MLDDGKSYEEIAEEMEVKEMTIISQLEKSRMFFAPYAATWVEKNDSEEKQEGSKE